MTLERKRLIVAIKDSVYEVTIDGKDVLEQIGKVSIVDGTPSVLSTKPETVSTKPDDYIQLHKKLQTKLYELTNMRQARGYSNAVFIPSAKDLQYYLNLFRRRYPELWNIDRITRCLEKHVQTCAKTGVYTPVIKYYIYKEEKGSQLAADLEAYDENEDDQHRIKKTKDLFE